VSINETVLEMHYHQALMDLFRSVFGVGPSGKISFYKYSPQKECFVGFDQAWVMTDVSDDKLFEDLKDAAQNNSYKLNERYIGYFLQYKVVQRMIRHSKKNPPPVKSARFGRSKISSQANPHTGQSQHELLFNLCKNKNALTYYACPAIFDKAELYIKDVDLGTLHLVDVASCPSDFTDHKKHHIFFDLPSMQPTWCSEPVEGRSIAPETLATSMRTRLLESPATEAERLLDCVRDLRGTQRERAELGAAATENLEGALQALTILKVEIPG
jgi:hypothetical protein